MADKIIETVDIDTKELLNKLNSLYADEWLAFIQYYVPIGLCKGMLRPDIESELEEHAKDEFEHLTKLKERIIQLNGKPLMSPKQFLNKTVAGYIEPESFNVSDIVSDNMESESRAIDGYMDLMEFTKGKDAITYRLARQILADEEEHIQDLTDFAEDLEQI